MTFIRSFTNDCSYILSLDGTNLLSAPMDAAGRVESNRGAYDYVDWDMLEGDRYDEADLCFSLLRSDYQAA